MASWLENERGGAKARTARSARESGIDNAGPGRASRSRSLGFMLYVWIACAIAIGGLGIALKIQGARLASEQTAHAETKGKYAAFVADTKRLGEEAKAKTEAEIKRQKEVSNATVKSYEKRLADSHARFAKLRDSRADSGQRAMPAVPDTARPVDDGARDQRLVDLLRHAQDTTDRLIELQGWVREQQAATR